MTYTEYFGLSEPPFGVTPDPRFIYPHSSYKEALATLQYGIEARKGFILVSGGAGAGKTTLLRMLIRSLDPSARTALISTSPVSFLELLQTILNDLQLPPVTDDRRVMMGKLNQFLIQELRRRRTVCLLVDNAQELSDELLEQIGLLSNLETDRIKLLQIALVGRPEFETKLERPELWQLKQRIVLRRRLQPLSSAEVGFYVSNRLRTAGCRRHDIFVPDAIEAIAAYSNGIPSLVNIICDHAMALASTTSRKDVSLALIEEAAHNLQLHRAAGSTAESLDAEGAAPEVEVVPGRASTVSEGWEIHAANLGRRGHRIAGRSQARLTSSPWIGVGMLLGLMTLAAASMLFHSREIGNSLWKLPGKLKSEGVHAQQLSPSEISPSPARPKISSEPFYLDDRAHGGPSSERSSSWTNPIAEKKYHKTDEIKQGTVRGPSPSTQTPQPRQRAETIERREARQRVFEVVASSFVRDKPQSDANIIAALQPGTRVRLIARRGEYFEVSWLNHTVSRGYVHREDAFFEPVRTGMATARSRSDNRR